MVADITQFTIGLSGNTGFPKFIGDSAGNGYTRGSLFVSSVEQTQSDINFKTFVGISIPEPTSLVLLFIGLTGLVFVRPLGH